MFITKEEQKRLIHFIDVSEIFFSCNFHAIIKENNKKQYKIIKNNNFLKSLKPLK